MRKFGTAVGNLFSGGQHKEPDDLQNISPLQPTMDASGSSPNESSSRIPESGVTTGSDSCGPAAYESGHVTKATRPAEQLPSGFQHSNVNEPAASRPPPYDSRNCDTSGNQMTEASAQAPPEGSNDRSARRLEGGNRKRDKQALEEDNKELKRDNKKLNRQLDEFDHAYKELKRKYEHELRRAASERVEHQKQTAYHERRHEALMTSHIRSVSSIGTGLEPITDETFEREFRKLHDDISEWCRKTFKSYKGGIRRLQEIDDIDNHEIGGIDKQEIDGIDNQELGGMVKQGIDNVDKSDYGPMLKDFLPTRLFDTNGMRVGDLMETIVWGYIEQKILCAWFPQIKSELQDAAAFIQNTMREADTLHPHAKAEFWRAYAASLLYQHHGVQAALRDVQVLSEDLLALLRQVQTDPIVMSKRSLEALQNHLRSAVVLASQLKCQSQYYEIRNDVKLGDLYESAKMIYVKDLGLQEMEDILVSCIVSKSVVKRAYDGADGVIAEICKARVLVSVPVPATTQSSVL